MVGNASIINFQERQQSGGFHDNELFLVSMHAPDIVLILTLPLTYAYRAFRVRQVSQGLSAESLWSWFISNVATMWITQLDILLMASALREKSNLSDDFFSWCYLWAQLCWVTECIIHTVYSWVIIRSFKSANCWSSRKTSLLGRISNDQTVKHWLNLTIIKLAMAFLHHD